MKMLILFIFFSFQAISNTEVITGSFTAKEVQPVLVWEYVSETCHRTESTCVPVCNQYGENCGPQCTDYNIPYECGVNQWVRKGSKPIFDLEIEYVIRLENVSIGLDTKVEIVKSEIDEKFTDIDLVKNFFKFTETQANFSVTEVKVEGLTVSNNTKRLQIMITGNLIDSIQVFRSLQDQTQVIKKDLLKISDNIPMDAINLNICVTQKRPMLPNRSIDLGCQVASSRDVQLDKISFENAHPRRELRYQLRWAVKGTNISGQSYAFPFIIFNQ